MIDMPELYITQAEQKRIAKMRQEKKRLANLSDEEYQNILAMRQKMAYAREAKKNIVWVDQNEYNWQQKLKIARMNNIGNPYQNYIALVDCHDRHNAHLAFMKKEYKE
jgi:hypothetical protein